MKTSIKAFGGTVLAAGLFITALSVAAQTGTTTNDCPVVTGFMKAGVANKSEDVTRLQTFLHDHENFDVDINGTFDAKTEDAVKAFQKKYQDEILTPWDATKASGIVYVTTGKKINQLACSIPLSLDAQELAIITNYKEALGTTTVAITETATMVTGDATLTPSIAPEISNEDQLVGPTTPFMNEGTSTYPEVAVTDESGENYAASAALGGGNMVHRFWSYFVGLFR